jgi:hypothetical protein
MRPTRRIEGLSIAIVSYLVTDAQLFIFNRLRKKLIELVTTIHLNIQGISMEGVLKQELIVLDGKVLNRLIEEQGLKSQENLALEIRVSPGSITHAITITKGISQATFSKIIKRLQPTREQLNELIVERGKVLPPNSSPHYTWENAEAAAMYVAGRLFGEGNLNPHAILTFAGASSLFAGLVLAKLPSVRDCLRIPVYNAVLVTKDSPERRGYRRWLTLPQLKSKQFAIDVPIALTEVRPRKKHKIAIIDDTIISGVTMETLREKFRKLKYPDLNIQFACFVCWRPRTEIPEKPPEIYVTEFISNARSFELPWGHSFCFEDHVPDVSESSPTLPAGSRS